MTEVMSLWLGDTFAGTSLTQEGRRWDCPVAPSDHHADASLHKRYGEVDDLRAFLIDGERADGHVCTLVNHLSQEKQREGVFAL